LGYMKTNIEYGLQHSEIGTSFSAYIIQLSKKLRTES
ncbi:UTP--glucose-1-phosphate uridylyltransferase, partial [Enterococcus faecium]